MEVLVAVGDNVLVGCMVVGAFQDEQKTTALHMHRVHRRMFFSASADCQIATKHACLHATNIHILR